MYTIRYFLILNSSFIKQILGKQELYVEFFFQ